MNSIILLLEITCLIATINCVSGAFRIKRQSACPEYKWRCDNGDCIDSHNLCDGKTDCSDKSDETSTACILIRCPSYSFRCTYGACINGNYECDGNMDCADNSDENTPKCPMHQDDPTGNCTRHAEFQCESGECKPVEELCDGIAHCPDGSDETEKRCSSIYCPQFGFQCSYGACVNGDAKCDKKKDCADASDETEALCGYVIDFDIIPRPTKRPPVGPPTTPPPGSCYTPQIPENGRIHFAHDLTAQLRPNQVIESGTAIVYKCYSKFVLLGKSEDICIEGEWIEEPPKCKKYCDPIPLNKISVTSHCELNGKTINCTRPIPPKTRVTIRCQIGYKKPDRPLPDVILCDDSGEWLTHPWKCEETCGVPSPEIIPYIVNGYFTEIRQTPWHVAIYSVKKDGYEYICGGSIISSRLVLSAAHCFWDVINSAIADKSKFRVAAGKTHRDIIAVEATIPQFFTISDIITKEQYLHDEGLYFHDIAVVVLSEFIIYKEYILPVCVDFNLRYSDAYVESGLNGTLSGWGLTEAGGNTSDTLKTLDLPSVDYRSCVSKSNPNFKKYITGDKFCAGHLNGQSACQGDSGGGLMFPRVIGGVETFFIYGIDQPE